LHAGLPWPLGTARLLEYGPVHAIGLSRAAAAIEMTGAEAPAPASADRLWEQAHPAEIELLIASRAHDRESFQSVSADLRVLYRVGLSDAAALQAAYAVTSAEDLVRASAGRVIARYFASRTLDDVLGADRDGMAAALRGDLQAALDDAGSGLQAVAVVIEAIHPPAGAADAYHNVRAAEIAARASVAVERGAAATIQAQSRQYAFDQTANASAQAAETVDGARTTLLRFTADQAAAQAGGRAFFLERYFAALTGALPKAPKTIIDSRLSGPEAPTLDLRPFAAAPSSGPGKEE
jgi:regulator of protease activity HflC (stomatin/prohibitin superfamily)